MVNPAVRLANVKGGAGQTAPGLVTVHTTGFVAGQMSPASMVSVRTTLFAGEGPWLDKVTT